jgi:LEA14-like dessication related protein
MRFYAKRKPRRAWACLFTLFLVAFSACVGALKRPEVSLEAIRLDGVGIEEQRFSLRLALHNPNAFEISIESMRFDLEIEGKTFAQGVLGAPVRIPGGGEARVEIAARGRLGTLFKSLREKLKKGGDSRLAYRIHGRAALEKLGVLPFDHKETLDLASLMRWGEAIREKARGSEKETDRGAATPTR